MNLTHSRPIEILLVEDSPGDVALVKAGLRRDRVLINLHVAVDGVAAMAFLEAGEPRPDLVLLDINLPRKNGHEVLRDMRSDERFMSIPVVVLTTSDYDKDIHAAYEHHANAYVTKPLTGAAFVQVVQNIEDFWLSVVQLPNE